VRDVDPENHLIHILDYDHRNLKSKFAKRAVPLWPKLAAVLSQSLARRPRPENGLLFPRAGADESKPLEEQMMTRIRKSLKSAAARAKIPKDIGHHIARHSYVSARLEMVEQGPMGNAVPVSPSTLVREVGHATDELIQTTYGHLTRKRVNDTRLDYGDDPVDLKARAERAAELMSEAVKQGLAKAKRRRAEEKALESEDGVLRIRLDDDGGEL
jgi:integrase